MIEDYGVLFIVLFVLFLVVAISFVVYTGRMKNPLDKKRTKMYMGSAQDYSKESTKYDDLPAVGANF